MSFSSTLFLCFFLPAFLVAYYATPGCWLRNVVTVLFSLLFIAWGEPIFVFYIIAGTAIDYAVVKYELVAQDRPLWRRRAMLTGAITLNVAALVIFKYTNFLADQFNAVAAAVGVPMVDVAKIDLPMGISFITFHKISFLIDLYKTRLQPPRRFADALLYILLFPQLVAGPIVRYQDIGAQISERRHTVDDFLNGMFRFGIGLVKKVLIADQVGRLADKVFAMPPEALPASYAWLGVAAYTVQIYFDFSGYSDMAIGLARCLGFRFPENFNRPYTAQSVTDFWRRWHMTLSTWMRLYLYIPLGGSRVGEVRTYVNLWIVFLLSGLWHGAAWTFIAWGAYYGFFLSAEKLVSQRGVSVRFPPALRWMLTFIAIMTGWVLFRSDSLDYAVRLLARMYGMGGVVTPLPLPYPLMFDDRGLAMLALGLVIALTPSWPFPGVASWRLPAPLAFAGGVITLAVGLVGVVATGYSPFLYFRF